jgi:PleD family two-component response regulator
MTRQDWRIKNNYPDQSGHSTRTERAETRTEQAETRTEQANARTEQADVRTEQANTRTEQAEARTEQANTRTKQAEMRAKEAEARNAGTIEKTATKTEKKRILAVDDRASNTRLVKLYLERTNEYVVREENDPKAALAAAEEFQPHLILLDVMMPGLDGGDLAACFQANPKLKAVPIVFLTAAVTKEEVKARGGRIGGHPFLAKPVVLTEMVACLKQHLVG